MVSNEWNEKGTTQTDQETLSNFRLWAYLILCNFLIHALFIKIFNTNICYYNLIRNICNPLLSVQALEHQKFKIVNATPFFLFSIEFPNAISEFS